MYKYETIRNGVSISSGTSPTAPKTLEALPDPWKKIVIDWEDGEVSTWEVISND